MSEFKFPLCHASRVGTVAIQMGTIQDIADNWADAVQVVASRFFAAQEPAPMNAVQLGSVHVWLPNFVDDEPNELVEAFGLEGDYSKSKIAIDVVSDEEPDDIIDEAVFKGLTDALKTLFGADVIEYRIFRHDQTIVPKMP